MQTKIGLFSFKLMLVVRFIAFHCICQYIGCDIAVFMFMHVVLIYTFSFMCVCNKLV